MPDTDLGWMIMKKILYVLMSISFIIVSCKQAPQTKESTEQATISRINRTDSIVFMGLKIGLLNENVDAVIDSSNVITKEKFPYEFDRYIGSRNNSMFDNLGEKTLSTFFTHIIDNNNESHDAWGIIKSDSDFVTTIQVIIPDYDKVQEIYNSILELYVERYGEPDQTYSGEVKSYLRNTGFYWDFPNSQRITLNKCEYSGTAGYDGGIDWASKFKGFERVEIVYQDLKAIQRQKQKEEMEEAARNQAERQRKDANRKARESQQL